MLRKAIFLAIATSATAVCCAVGQDLMARTRAYVEKARLVYPKDADNTISAVSEYVGELSSNVVASSDANVVCPVRWMDVPGIRNLRDIGGWNGLVTGMVYRGSCIATNVVGGFTNPLHFKTEIDLREQSEILVGEVRCAPNYINCPLKSYTNMFDQALGKSYAKVLRIFGNRSNYPIYIHCAGGADRTASVLFLLEGLCGVSRTDVEIDYELTSLSGSFGLRSRTDSSYKPFRPWMIEMLKRPGEDWRDKVANFVKEGLGLTTEEIDAVRRNLMNRRIRDIPYAPENGMFGLGDLYLPESLSGKSPVVLAIHGGGWNSGDRYSWSGVAEFFCHDIGCVVFNIEYRLASAASRWPACGEDCVKAAKWLFSDGFRERAGFSPEKIYICGGSAGGHLALWTLVNLPPEKVAGAVSIASIGDPKAAYHALKGCYHQLFGAKVRKSDFAAMNPIRKIRPGMPPLLCTHAMEDKVVPIASHKVFADAYRAAGNACEFFEYSANVQNGLTGHCIWIPGSKPHRLIPEIESRIAAFVKGTSK